MTPAQYLENIARRMGLANTSKVKMTTEMPTSDGRTKSGYKDHEVEAHRGRYMTLQPSLMIHIYFARLFNTTE